MTRDYYAETYLTAQSLKDKEHFKSVIIDDKIYDILCVKDPDNLSIYKLEETLIGSNTTIFKPKEAIINKIAEVNILILNQ